MQQNEITRGSITTFFAICVIVISIIAGFFAYQNQRLVAQIKELSKPQVSTSATSTPQPTEDPIQVASPSASPKNKSKAELCKEKTYCPNDKPCMANPASVFCTCMGGKSVIKTLENGGETGVCVIDGKEMDEWEYFRSFNNDSSTLSKEL